VYYGSRLCGSEVLDAGGGAVEVADDALVACKCLLDAFRTGEDLDRQLEGIWSTQKPPSKPVQPLAMLEALSDTLLCTAS
jgi:hypothetical protein